MTARNHHLSIEKKAQYRRYDLITKKSANQSVKTD
jgi:hypothetical protein